MKPLQASLLREWGLAQECAELVRLGLRPKAIRSIIGSAVSKAEIQRIYKMLTPLDGRGRSIEISGYVRLRSDQKLFLSNLVQKTLHCIDQGASLPDAVCASWRIETSAAGEQLGQPVHGLSFEWFATLLIKVRHGEIAWDFCPSCQTQYLTPLTARTNCPSCSSNLVEVLRA